ncbi:4-alpha-glucanotransferase DPE2-like [Hibiscus syriacus]|uniref:4-alpha-glucanotransferase DPE2-like n=1 Tax=Hibiscus syriacus TaxID=106335 RepID=UPI0019205164|nr:4-alpha-glucanotransferase DPE2-like [Hibiscus syriacus]
MSPCVPGGKKTEKTPVFQLRDGLPPYQCVPDVAYFVLRQHVESPSMWAISPPQYLLALKEEYATRPAMEGTINDPTNPKHYRRYRVHVTMESLMEDKELKATIKDLIQRSGQPYPPLVEAVNQPSGETDAIAL